MWEIDFVDGGVGKHGNGPYAARALAEAALRESGFAGVVVPLLVTKIRPRPARGGDLGGSPK